MHQGGDLLDALLTQKMMDYPYAARKAQLVSISPRIPRHSTASDYSGLVQSFITQLGAVYERGCDATKLQLRSVVQSGELPTPGQPAEVPRQHGRERVRGGDIELPRYTSAIKEYGDRTGIDVQWTDECVSVSPQLWRVWAHVGGTRFFGTGDNKKLARHLASQQACQRFAVEA
ncbi:hypothetical protein BAUCODRAFT_32985 [Baudoinia panamericana UAMH 10762]|uniref:DRBM domain-containing protein n=1 Tax=Baudoinia panamericana (strain UAMH 10762) TaxID=717646 RepID=M2N005_BAUPA|nr:uncharacterized protein BAUCODRAFT_32985 [Baudoinia panamericana UAMH 10762]EMC97238.1 hypothetical protein BAUCODRAFT_32985 [Baudoinia panamericana UAMH 10762]